MRKKTVIANWKMNKDWLEVQDFIDQFKATVPRLPLDEVEVMIAPPFLYLREMNDSLAPLGIGVLSQNCGEEEKGAFTGEVAVGMIKSTGVLGSIVGHSERRNLFGESDAQIAKKVNRLIAMGMKAILCCGEDEQERDSGQHLTKVKAQINNALAEVSDTGTKFICVAYEPVWAIGTGKTASADQIAEMHNFLRETLVEKWGASASDVPILYGGSCNAGNAKSIFSIPNVDGGLIGGASLEVDSFFEVINAAG